MVDGERDGQGAVCRPAAEHGAGVAAVGNDDARADDERDDGGGADDGGGDAGERAGAAWDGGGAARARQRRQRVQAREGAVQRRAPRGLLLRALPRPRGLLPAAVEEARRLLRQVLRQDRVHLVAAQRRHLRRRVQHFELSIIQVANLLCITNITKTKGTKRGKRASRGRIWNVLERGRTRSSREGTSEMWYESNSPFLSLFLEHRASYRN
jgi:hypothetical protein